MTVGENIKKFRLEKGMTQKELGDMCGLADSAIRRYELGGANPKMETLHKIAKALDKSIILLVEGCEDKYPLTEGDFKTDLENSMTDNEYALYNAWKKQQKNNILLETLKPGETTVTLDIVENKLLSDYRQLNGNGKMEAIKRVEELTEIPRYTAEEKEALENYSKFVDEKTDDYWENLKNSLQVVDQHKNDDTK